MSHAPSYEDEQLSENRRDEENGVKQREEERAQKERADWEAARDAVAQTWNAPPEEAAALQPLRSLLLSTRA